MALPSFLWLQVSEKLLKLEQTEIWGGPLRGGRVEGVGVEED